MAIQTTKLLNRKLYFMGMNPIQALIGIIIMSITFLIFGFTGLAITAAPILWVGAKIAKQNKAGNPDYLEELIKTQNIRRQYEDKEIIMQYLKKNIKKNGSKHS